MMSVKEEVSSCPDRLVYIDITRAICTLWIVGFWHLANHSSFSNSIPYGADITTCVLSCFMFLSGYVNSRKDIVTWKDARTFYHKRFIRLYPLFFVSCTALLVMNRVYGQQYIINLRQYFLTLIGLSYFILPAPSTVYFASLLMLFYLITPIILRFHRGGYLVGLSLYVLFILVYVLSNHKYINAGIFELMFFYLLGIFLRFHEFKYKFKIMVLSIMMTILGFWAKNEIAQGNVPLNYILTFFYCFSFIYSIINIAHVLTANEFLVKIFRLISKGSMCAYLFHRPIYFAMNRIFGSFSVVFAVAVALPFLIIISYGMQMGYDLILSYLEKDHKTTG